jgi:hypothetical protein
MLKTSTLITKDIFKAKFIDEINNDPYNANQDSFDVKVHNYISPILNSIQFPVAFYQENIDLYDHLDEDILVRQTPGKICYLLVEVGADYEHPVHIVIYLNTDFSFDIYLPLQGNTFHQSTMSTYGNEDNEDIQISDWCSNSLSEDDYDPWEHAKFDNKEEVDFILLEQDIDNHIKPI